MARARLFAVAAVVALSVSLAAGAQGPERTKERASPSGFPAAGMKRASLEAKMKALLVDAGWPEVKRLAIVDKAWWIDRVAGPDSPVESRHLDAAAAACDAGGCYYRVCTFHQWAVAGGGFGDLELTTEGPKRPLSKSEAEE